ncbi:MAG: hypothetical protein JNM62_07960 [Flavobacteriales bacterium]|nr:hypothetical protein [Flavobacteriales bacterium]
MDLRYILLLLAFGITAIAHGQTAKLQVGQPFQRVAKDASGDVYAVMGGIMVGDKEGLFYVEDNMVQKVVRVDGQMKLAEELVLKNIAFDAAVWNGVAPIVVDGTLHCLLASNTKKTTDFAIAQVDARGAPALGVIKRVASSEILFNNDPTTSLPYRPVPDPILFSKGLKYAHAERIIASPDGQHFLLNTYTNDQKGNKRIWCSYLDKEFTELWSATATLPYGDDKSRIHQISLANDGTIHLLAYLFPCETEAQQSDKLCHETHLTTLTERGKTVKDILVDKDFVSSARLCERDGGKVSMAIRYGSLTGQPGWVLTFDPMDAKLKTTPLVDQRITSIKKTKLMAYGSIEPGAKKGVPSKTAKVPNEIVQLIAAWDGLVLVETFLETAFEVPMGEAIAMRRLGGDVRTSFIAANDSIKWQHIAERAFMTTAGQSYDGVDVHLNANGLTLLYDHTPKGLDAILRSGQAPVTEGEEKKGKKEKIAAPAESGVLKAITLDPRGTVVAEGTALIHPDGFMPCPEGSVEGASGKVYLVKTFDRKNSYSFALIDASIVGK